MTPFSRAPLAAAITLFLAAACGSAVPRFPDSVHAALARDEMRRLETESLIIYYPAARRDQILRFADRAEGCATELKARARIHNRFWREKLVVVMPDMPFNNAYVSPAAFGNEEIAVVPTYNTMDFATLFGLPPDPAHIACHELTHYVHSQQIAGGWSNLDTFLGELITPQVGLEPWFFEGLATHYESILQPGAGRPRWPVFRGMFHAAYAGGDVGGGDLSEWKRKAAPGHHYLVGAFFLDFLIERYGEESVWKLIALQASSFSFLTGVSGRFDAAFGKDLPELIDDFAEWTATRFPRRPTPADQRRIRELGIDARYARGPGGDEAVVSSDDDAPTRLTVWGTDGRERATVSLVEVVPPRQLVMADPVLTTGLSITADGRVFVTVLDLGATFQTTRLLRWDGALDEVATGLGPGAAVDPAGRTYYHMIVDGDRWQLGAYDLATGARRLVTAAAPGQYIVGAQVSPDGRRLVASVWDRGFVLWLIDAASGARLSEIRTNDHTPVFDGAFVDDATITYLAEVDGRFQVAVRDLASGATRIQSDAPYAALHPRPAAGTIRFLNRQGWRWTVDEVAIARPAPPAPPPPPPSFPPVPTSDELPSSAPPDASAPAPEPAVPATPDTTIAVAAPPATTAPVQPPSLAPTGPGEAASRKATVLSDGSYSYFDRLFVPQLHTVSLTVLGPGATLVGAALSGGDRLGFQRWAVAAYWQPNSDDVSVLAAYINAMLAPWMINVSGSRLAWTETVQLDAPRVEGKPAPTATVARGVRNASLSLERTWRGTLSAALSGTIVEDDSKVIKTPEPITTTGLRRLGGAGLAFGYGAFESTRVTGARRGLALSLEATYFPAALSTLDQALTDTRAALTVVLPIPIGRRHALSLAGRGHALIASSDNDLLQVGGLSTLLPLWQSTESNLDTDNLDRLPGGLRFSEPLRGYEDLAILTDAVAIGDLSWTYPIVIDRGIPVTLWWFPSSFVRQIDLELFGTAAVDQHGLDAIHAAAGGAIDLQLVLARIPMTIAYQASRRLADDNAWLQLVGVGVGL